MKDPRYATIKGLMAEGKITKFEEIFDWIAYTAVANDLGKNHNTMKIIKTNPERMTVAEIWKLADLIGCDKKKLGIMALEQVKLAKERDTSNNLDETK